MNVFRRLIALLLMTTVPAYAWAVVALPDPCAMSAPPTVEAADPEHACCDSHLAASCAQQAKGNACPSGQPCKTGVLHHLRPSGVPEPVLTTGRLVASVETHVFSRDPRGIWRPPRSA